MKRYRIRTTITLLALSLGFTSTGCVEAVTDGLTDGLRATMASVVEIAFDTAVERIMDDAAPAE